MHFAKMKKNNDFHLSAVLAGHEQDVRALIGLSNDLIASASRDRRVIIWQRLVATEPLFVQKSVFSGHTHFVNALAYQQPSTKHPNGLVYSGGSDKIIYAFDYASTEQPVFTLVGHRDNVCALTVSPKGKVVSGSWDRTCKVWRDGVCIQTLEGHEQAVWSVVVVDEVIITASADRTIKIWKAGTAVNTIKGHSDVVRSLVDIPGVGFASCSNDSTVRLWDLAGNQISEFHGHSSFAYSLCRISPQELASSGEDRSVRIWGLGKGLIQTLTQPCVSVWCVAALLNGDVIAGGSDGVIRVFSRAPERLAEPDLIKNFEAALESSAIPSNQVGDIDKSKLPGVDALNVMGKKEGEVKMVKHGNAVEAHQWSSSEAKWIKIGEVVDAVGGSRKQVFDGKEYDYVFDVDIQEGVPPLKLPYNATENPYESAKRFIDRNELPDAYLDQIADFIIKNTKGVSLGETSQAADPFTGSNRYVPQGQQSSVPNTKNNDGAQYGRPGQLVPMTTYTFFKMIKYFAVFSKIEQNNAEITRSPDISGLALKPDQMQQLKRLISLAESNELNAFGSPDYKLLSQIAFQWPDKYRFPGIDLLRSIILQTSFPAQADSEFIGSLMEASNLPAPENAKLSKETETNAMLAVRALSNMFAHEESFKKVNAKRQEVLLFTQRLVKSVENKGLRVALATLYLNFAVALKLSNADDAFAVDLLEVLCEMVGNESDYEALARELVSIGTLVSASSTVREAASLLDVRDIVKRDISGAGDLREKISQIQTELAQIIS